MDKSNPKGIAFSHPMCHMFYIVMHMADLLGVFWRVSYVLIWLVHSDYVPWSYILSVWLKELTRSGDEQNKLKRYDMEKRKYLDYTWHCKEYKTWDEESNPNGQDKITHKTHMIKEQIKDGYMNELLRFNLTCPFGLRSLIRCVICFTLLCPSLICWGILCMCPTFYFDI
jgi:hypothetical protein